MNSNQNVDLRKTLKTVIKKCWILLLLLLVFAVGARLVSIYFVEKIYQAQTTMFIGKEKGTIGNIGLSFADLQTYNQLIVDYKEIANSRLVIMATINNLKMNMDVVEFRKALSIDIIQNSRLFTVSFSSNDPVVAANVTNEMAKQLSVAVADIVNVENIRILDKALVPNKPVFPNDNLITIIAGALGLILGLFIIYLMEVFNESYSSQEDIEQELELEVLGVIPRPKKRKEFGDTLATLSGQYSLLSESYRVLRTNINYINMNDESKVIMLTSSMASEGKTTTSCNLAVAMAQANKKVLLIDADFRKSTVHDMFKLNKRPGLINVLYDDMSLEEVIKPLESIQGLDILTAGKKASIPTQLVETDLFEKLIADARNLYDIIIIDAPPVLHVSDTVIISKMADKVIFVVAMGETNKEVVRESKRSLERVGVNILGMVLTKMDLKHKNYYFSPEIMKNQRR